jgi:MoxR-like ATPase
MQEHQVTIGRESHRVPDPFLVLATQNPIETEGTYPLPEAQVDRFMLKVLVDYPTDREEVVVVQRLAEGLVEPRPIITPDVLIDLQRQADRVYVDPEIMEYAVQLVGATRRLGDYGAGDLARYISYGASPRASINLVLGARSLALLHGRDYVIPKDVADLAGDVLRHRLVLSYEAFADRVTPDQIIDRVMELVQRPARPLAEMAPAGRAPAASEGSGRP